MIKVPLEVYNHKESTMRQKKASEKNPNICKKLFIPLSLESQDASTRSEIPRNANIANVHR